MMFTCAIVAANLVGGLSVSCDEFEISQGTRHRGIRHGFHSYSLGIGGRSTFMASVWLGLTYLSNRLI